MLLKGLYHSYTSSIKFMMLIHWYIGSLIHGQSGAIGLSLGTVHTAPE